MARTKVLRAGVAVDTIAAPVMPTGLRIVLQKDLADTYGITISVSTIARMVERGEFPPPFKLTEESRLNAWNADVVEAWIRERIGTARGNG
jgi:predicted DNA-binding transcriptional regulator AlpA